MPPNRPNRFARSRIVAPLAGVVLLALVGQLVRAEEPTERGDLKTIRRRTLDPLLEPVEQGQVEALADALRPDGSWPQVDYADLGRSGWKTPRHLGNLLLLSRAYKSPKSDLCGDPALKRAVFAALDYWLRHDFQNPNWWWNQIGVPRSLWPTLLLLDGDISDAQRTKGLEILARARIGMTGQNLVWVTEITAMRGILLEDPELVAKAYRRIGEEIRLSTGEGIQPDLSFHQHGACLYSHGYGAAFVSDCSRIATRIAGTRLAFPAEKIELLSRLILDGHQWLGRGGACDYGAVGRQIARKGQTSRYLGAAAGNMLELPTGREAEFRALAARAVGEPAPALEGNRHFWRSDVMAHHRRGYYASARMFSRRIVNTDYPCNSEGLASHHIADGCNFIFRSGGEYTEIFPAWDWQKVPGTTVEQTPELAGPVRVQGLRGFVGGVSDGTYGLAAFDFARGTLTARKAWVFFDTEFVCLGAGITCTSDHPVVTTVNQCLLGGAVVVSDGEQTSQPDKGTHGLENPAWVYHDGIAYCFPEPSRVTLRNDVQRGSWWAINHQYSKDEVSREVFTLWIDHGRAPEGASYAYVVVPDTPLPAAADRPARSGVQILRNEPECQAVRHAGLKTTGIAFYEPGSVHVTEALAVGVDKPCLVLLRELPDKLAVSVSNPENQPLAVVVEVSGRFAGADVEVPAGGTTSRVTFQLPGGPNAGKSVTRTLLRS